MSKGNSCHAIAEIISPLSPQVLLPKPTHDVWLFLFLWWIFSWGPHNSLPYCDLAPMGPRHSSPNSQQCPLSMPLCAWHHWTSFPRSPTWSDWCKQLTDSSSIYISSEHSVVKYDLTKHIHLGCGMGPSSSEFWMAQEIDPCLKFPETRHKTCNIKNWLISFLIDHIQQGSPSGQSEGKMQAISLSFSQNVVVKAINDQFCSWNLLQIRLWSFCPHDPLGEEGEATWG